MHYKRIVVKLGTNLITAGTDKLSHEVIADLVTQIAQLRSKKLDVILVSSGAIAAGRQKLALERNRKDIPFKQVLASVGQNQLMNTYEHFFAQHRIIIAQTLLTKIDLSDRQGYLNARNTLMALLEVGVVPIVNENDVVAIDEIDEAKFGDNDNLSAMVTNLIDADLLILLSDVDGLCTSDPAIDKNATVIPRIEVINDSIERLAGCTRSKRATGGMVTKLKAAKLATDSGASVIIANGREPEILLRLANGELIGTLFLPARSHMESRKRWMLSGLSSKGRVIIDAGALNALTRQNRSLLPAGIIDIDGRFRRGDIVTIVDQQQQRVGCGISNYSSVDIMKIKGKRSEMIINLLGYEYGSEVVHKNNLVLP